MEHLAAAAAVRAFYLAASALILVVQAVPVLRDRFLAYGSRATSAKPSPSPSPSPSHATQPSAMESLLDHAASFQVPHNYFTHFYVVSVASSVFWAWKLRLWDAGGQLPILWALMLLQGVRRLVESYLYTATSKSKMWFAHWILGLLFYLATNVAIWVELQADIETRDQSTPDLFNWRTAALVPAVLMAQVLQHIYHAYLYRLRTQNADYQLPSHPLFPNLLCPHYTCDIAIYAFLSLLGAPAGRIVNWTLATATLFTAVNLGVTAIATKAWYEDKFGRHKVSIRRRMIPWIW